RRPPLLVAHALSLRMPVCCLFHARTRFSSRLRHAAGYASRVYLGCAGRIGVGPRSRAVEGEMRQKPPKARLRLDLTKRQKEQIREATGREVSSLELGLDGLPEPHEAAARDEAKTDR